MIITPASFNPQRKVDPHKTRPHEFFPAKYNSTWAGRSFSHASQPENKKLKLVFDVETSSFGSWKILGSRFGQTKSRGGGSHSSLTSKN